MLAYDFGPKHPLKPERLRRAIALVESLVGECSIDPGPLDLTHLLLAHDGHYIEFLQRIERPETPATDAVQYGFGKIDNPRFDGVFSASCAYVSGSVAAANAVVSGAHRAFNLSGGLHHARRNRAHGFCVFNDCVIAITLLQRKFPRVAYVDLDVHHGEGVQFAFEDDSTVLTCSIHQDGRTLFPGTGAISEHGPHFNAVNVPLPRGTGIDAWLLGVREGILPALRAFKPDALVLQCGTDSHFEDPLAHINNTARGWQAALSDLHNLSLPTVCLGGGGYALNWVPRFWTAAVLTLMGLPIPRELPESLSRLWGVSLMHEDGPVPDAAAGKQEVMQTIEALKAHVFPRIPSG